MVGAVLIHEGEALHAVLGGAGFGEVVEKSQRVSLATTELGGEIVDCRGLDLDVYVIETQRSVVEDLVLPELSIAYGQRMLPHLQP